ncbi:MAG: ABC transporter permease, partial [Candidatus Lokiarchaeota archaeon]|nr:ABC transporter permease [Candidatus Lokiarchaeota archaeon]
FVGISLAFLIPRLLPGDPLRQFLSSPTGDADSWQRAIDELRAYYHYDEPLINQYGYFLYDFFFNGNLGVSFSNGGRPVIDIVMPYIPYTLLMVIPVTIITFIIGNWIGARTGYSKGKASKVGYYLIIAMQSAPFFWMAYVFINFFVYETHWLPYGEYPPPIIWGDFNNLAQLIEYYWLPFLVMVTCFSGGWATGMRSLMVYEKESDYILYCRKLGFSESKLRRYAMRNSLLPQLTGLNLRFNEILGATLIIEAVFLWPGLGTLIVQAFVSGDYNLIIGAFIVTILIIVIGNFIIDLMYGFIDPRIRVGGNQ